MFQPNWMGGGTLELPQGRTIRLAAANVWRSEWVWEEIKDAPVVRFKSQPGLLKTGAHVDLATGAVAPDDLALLVTLGWYLIVLYSEDAAAAGAMGAISASSG